MIKIDQTQWPIVYIEVDGLATVTAMEEYNTEMEKLLDFAEQQPKKFGIIYISEMSDEEYKQHKREREAQRLSNAWLKQNKPRIGATCVGIAMVTKATGMMKIMRPIAKRSMKRMMGAPGDVFFELSAAETWMQGVMADASQAAEA